MNGEELDTFHDLKIINDSLNYIYFGNDEGYVVHLGEEGRVVHHNDEGYMCILMKKVMW